MISGEHKEARYIEAHGKSGPGKSGDYCTPKSKNLKNVYYIGAKAWNRSKEYELSKAKVFSNKLSKLYN